MNIKKQLLDARKIFTVPAQKGGKIYGDDFIENFIYANRKKYEAMNDLKIVNEMAEVLNVKKDQLAKSYSDRNLLRDYRYLEEN
jgi:hypothetical protein